MANESLIDKDHLHLKVVHEISDLINKSTGLDTILSSVVRKIGDSLNFDVVSIYIWDDNDERLFLKANRGLNVGAKQIVTLSSEEGLTGLVFKSMRPLNVTPASKHENYKYFPEIGEEEFESYIGIPIILNNKCVGVLVGQTKESRHINPAEETLFQIIASRLAGLLEVADTLERLKTPTVSDKKTKTYQGKGVSSGIAIGEVFPLRGLFKQVRLQNYKTTNRKNEEKKLSKAFKNVEEDLKQLISKLSRENILSESEIDIFQAHLMILNSDSLQNTILEKLNEDKINAEVAVVRGIESIAVQFENLEDRYLKEKAQDFRDIGERILHELMSSSRKKDLISKNGTNVVIFADEIGPSFVSMITKSNVIAIVAEKGGETSHAVIIAKSLEIPVVLGIENICDLVRSGEKVIVDGRTGFVFVNPEENLIEEYENTKNELSTLKKVVLEESQSQKNRNRKISITANIGLPIDIELAKQYEITDVGLFRTEFAFTQFDKWPGVREQVQVYKEVSKKFDGYTTIRTLDIGADKILPYFNIPEEENPLLGLRAIRFSMEYLNLFRDQLRAILLATKKGCKFKILLPMVSNVWEVETARQIIEDLVVEIGIPSDDVPPLGIMLEVPALVYQLRDYKDLIDFVSVGTNDLIQYLLAVDRNSNVVGHLYSFYHPAVLRMMSDIFNMAHEIKKELSICGEMAGSPAGALILLSLGYKHLSINPSSAPIIRFLINKVSDKMLKEVWSEISVKKKESDIERYIADILESIEPALLRID